MLKILMLLILVSLCSCITSGKQMTECIEFCTKGLLKPSAPDSFFFTH